MKKNIKLVLEYDGSRYDGWQKLGNTDNTIQGKLEAILQKWTGEEIEIHGSGRTDAGVHAKGQVANFHVDAKKCPDAKTAMDYLNRYLPEDIRILKAEDVEERFHSRLRAIRKTYAYMVETGEKKSVFERKYVYGLGEQVDVEMMRKAASILIGEHDFKSFCGNSKMKKSTVRTVDRIEVVQKGDYLYFRFHGNGFLQNMVRILVGTLLEVGYGKIPVEQVEQILLSCNRQLAGPTAPPQGLSLTQVDY